MKEQSTSTDPDTPETFNAMVDRLAGWSLVELGRGEMRWRQIVWMICNEASRQGHDAAIARAQTPGEPA